MRASIHLPRGMYCDDDECAEFAPCPIHSEDISSNSETIYGYEVSSQGTIYSHFTSLTSECEQEKHGCEWFDSCSHFVHYRKKQKSFIFTSTMHLADGDMYWNDDMWCRLCRETIHEDDNSIINISDMCEFHKACIDRYLHNHTVDVCPGCDASRCAACWKCSY
jgi:hypothetical protein